MTDVMERAALISTDDQAALLDSVARLLAARCTEADVRRIMATEDGHDAALWRALADLGLPGLLAPPEHGGIGAGAVEAERVMELAGAALLPAPLASAWLATTLLAATDKDGLASEIASGERLAAVAFADDWPTGSDLRVEHGALTGTARFVPDAQVADTILIVHDGALYATTRNEAHIAPLPTFDHTRRMADVTVTRARRLGDADPNAFALAAVALAGEQAGGARRMLDMSVDYARTRHQFGRAIGSFQAIKHMAADLLLEAESATSAARDAARQLAEDAPGKDAAVALAAFACADAYVRVAKDAVQMHGGIAFTWDHPAHLYLRRARSAAQIYGDAALWRERYLCALERTA